MGYSPQGHKESDTSEDDLTGTLPLDVPSLWDYPKDVLCSA